MGRGQRAPRHEARDAAVAQAEARARLDAQAAAITNRLAIAEEAQCQSANNLETVQGELEGWPGFAKIRHISAKPLI